jgi:hypothetical protein
MAACATLRVLPDRIVRRPDDGTGRLSGRCPDCAVTARLPGSGSTPSGGPASMTEARKTKLKALRETIQAAIAEGGENSAAEARRAIALAVAAECHQLRIN